VPHRCFHHPSPPRNGRTRIRETDRPRTIAALVTPGMYTTFALASEDASGRVLGRVMTPTEFSAGDVIQMASEGGQDPRLYKVIRVLFLEQIGPDRWTNRLVMVRPSGRAALQ